MAAYNLLNLDLDFDFDFFSDTSCILHKLCSLHLRLFWLRNAGVSFSFFLSGKHSFPFSSIEVLVIASPEVKKCREMIGTSDL